jgi:hypothetical protein
MGESISTMPWLQQFFDKYKMVMQCAIKPTIARSIKLHGHSLIHSLALRGAFVGIEIIRHF